MVIDQAIHSLDLVRYLMGCEPVKVKGHIDRRILTNIEVEDVADAAITFENGAVYSFFACNYYTSNSPIRVEISGENGTALLTQNEVLIQLKGQEPKTIYPSVGPDVKGEAYWGNYHEIQLRDFYRCLREGRPVPTDPEDAKRTLGLVLDIYRSSRENREIITERQAAERQAAER